MTDSFKHQKITDNPWLNCIKKVTQLYYYQFPSKERFDAMYCLKFIKTIWIPNYETFCSLIQVKLMISSKRSQQLIQKKMTICLTFCYVNDKFSTRLRTDKLENKHTYNSKVPVSTQYHICRNFKFPYSQAIFLTIFLCNLLLDGCYISTAEARLVSYIQQEKGLYLPHKYIQTYVVTYITEYICIWREGESILWL